MSADRSGCPVDLLTTDILGPFNAPYAISLLGLVPGVLLYFFFGLLFHPQSQHNRSAKI